MKYNLQIPEIRDNYLFNLLTYRGVKDYESFMNPTEKELLDPTLLDNMAEGAALLKENLDKRMVVLADCDVDGFTSASIAYQYIKLLNPEADISYIVHEHKQHGLEDVVERIKKEKYSLAIIPDAGTNDYDYIEELKTYGTKVLILDHHLKNEEALISDNCVLINNQTSERYTNKELTGAGVVWQFCRYLDRILNVNFAEQFMDLAALGIVSDMGSILSMENRYIIQTGFSNIKNYFLERACEKQSFSMQNKINYNSVAFYITPSLNSMIRVGSMPEKERLFLAFIDGHRLVPCNKRGAKGTLEEVAIESWRECTNTKNKQDKITTAAMEQLSVRIFNDNLLDNKLLFVELDEEDDFPQEVNGLVAMKLSNKYKRPTLLGRRNYDNEVKGSIRGLSNCEMGSMRNFLLDSNLMMYVSGHDLAAGYGIEGKKIPKLHEYANEKLKDIDFSEDSYDVDFIRNAKDKDLSELIFDLGQDTSIWGQNNKEPLIYINGIYLTKDSIRIMGRNKDTISFEINGIKYIKFFAKELIEKIEKLGEGFFNIEVVGKPSINEWMGKFSPQIFIESYDLRKPNLSF